MSREMRQSGIEWIGEIPKEWKVVRAKSVFSQRSTKGNTTEILLSATQKQGMLPQSMLEGVVQTNVNTDLQTFKTVHRNDFVISLRSFQGGFEMSNYEGVCSPAYQVFFNRIPISHQFFWLLFKSYGFIEKINSLTVGIREGKNIQYKDFANMMLAIPSFQEQQKIADYLDKVCGEVDELIALQEKMIEELKAYKQSVITEAVTKGLNPNVPMRDSGIDWIGEIPEGWKICRIKDLVETKSGSNLTTEQIANDGLYPVYGGNGIRGYYSEYSNEGEFILIGRQGALCGNINYASGKFWATEHAVVCYPKREFKLRWLGELFRTMNLGQYSLSAAQPGLAVERIKVLKMPLPPIEEQQSIASYLDERCKEIDSLIALKQAKIEELKEYKKSVIYEYVTGKKEVV